jgi:hypothetical protein
MNSVLTRLFWCQAALAVVAGLILAATLVWPHWIELAFGVDPDRGTGMAEWMLAVSSGAVFAVATVLASYSYHLRKPSRSPTTVGAEG